MWHSQTSLTKKVFPLSEDDFCPKSGNVSLPDELPNTTTWKSNNAISRFDDGTYTYLRKNLLKEKGSALQKDFVAALQSRKSFLKYIESKIKIKEATETPCLNEQLTESEFKEPPKIIERNLFALWKEIPPAIACRVAFWAMITPTAY